MEEKKPEPKKTVNFRIQLNHMSEIISPMTGLKKQKTRG